MFQTQHLHSHFSITLLSSFIVIIIYFLTPLIATGPHHIFIYASCSQTKFQNNDTTSSFQNNLNSFFSSVVSSSSQTAYNSFTQTASQSDNDNIFGLYQCRSDLTKYDCTRCVQNLVNQLTVLCPSAYSASLQLEGCFLRYDNRDFLWKLDTSVKYKKCSHTRGVDSDADFYRRRDDVLKDLENDVVGFKVAGSGLVEGFVQCLGDLSPSDCDSCVSEAVETLRSLCGSSATGDVFLSQCYARYWVSGYSDFSDSSHGDDMGKTVAIIVGVLAGLAIIIVLLSLCRRSVGGK